ncbi:MAG: hypothetical protein IPP72_17265 [Chitinophagaceae bacterium]|nr:hypothetical protein [Chitinophagaceae bacterium]
MSIKFFFNEFLKKITEKKETVSAVHPVIKPLKKQAKIIYLYKAGMLPVKK